MAAYRTWLSLQFVLTHGAFCTRPSTNASAVTASTTRTGVHHGCGAACSPTGPPTTSLAAVTTGSSSEGRAGPPVTRLVAVPGAARFLARRRGLLLRRREDRRTVSRARLLGRLRRRRHLARRGRLLTRRLARLQARGRLGLLGRRRLRGVRRGRRPVHVVDLRELLALLPLERLGHERRPGPRRVGPTEEVGEPADTVEVLGARLALDVHHRGRELRGVAGEPGRGHTGLVGPEVRRTGLAGRGAAELLGGGAGAGLHDLLLCVDDVGVHVLGEGLLLVLLVVVEVVTVAAGDLLDHEPVVAPAL